MVTDYYHLTWERSYFIQGRPYQQFTGRSTQGGQLCTFRRCGNTRNMRRQNILWVPPCMQVKQESFGAYCTYYTLTRSVLYCLFCSVQTILQLKTMCRDSPIDKGQQFEARDPHLSRINEYCTSDDIRRRCMWSLDVWQCNISGICSSRTFWW